RPRARPRAPARAAPLRSGGGDCSALPRARAAALRLAGGLADAQPAEETGQGPLDLGANQVTDDRDDALLARHGTPSCGSVARAYSTRISKARRSRSRRRRLLRADRDLLPHALELALAQQSPFDQFVERGVRTP